MSSSPYTRRGAMRSYVDLQIKSQIPDAAGGSANDWVTERKLFCHIRPLSGSQRVEGDRRESSVTHAVYMNYAPDVDPDTLTEKRIRDEGGATYNIVAAWCPNDINEFVHATAVRGVAT